MKLSKDQIEIIPYDFNFIVHIKDDNFELMDTSLFKKEIIKVDKDHIYWKNSNGLLERYTVNRAPVFKYEYNLDAFQVNKLLDIEVVDVLVSPYKFKYQVAKSKIDPLLDGFHYVTIKGDFGKEFLLTKD